MILNRWINENNILTLKVNESINQHFWLWSAWKLSGKIWKKLRIIWRLAWLPQKTLNGMPFCHFGFEKYWFNQQKTKRISRIVVFSIKNSKNSSVICWIFSQSFPLNLIVLCNNFLMSQIDQVFFCELFFLN